MYFIKLVMNFRRFHVPQRSRNWLYRISPVAYFLIFLKHYKHTSRISISVTATLQRQYLQTELLLSISLELAIIRNLLGSKLPSPESHKRSVLNPCPLELFFWCFYLRSAKFVSSLSEHPVYSATSMASWLPTWSFIMGCCIDFARMTLFFLCRLDLCFLLLFPFFF